MYSQLSQFSPDARVVASRAILSMSAEASHAAKYILDAMNSAHADTKSRLAWVSVMAHTAGGEFERKLEEERHEDARAQWLRNIAAEETRFRRVKYRSVVSDLKPATPDVVVNGRRKHFRTALGDIVPVQTHSKVINRCGMRGGAGPRNEPIDLQYMDMVTGEPVPPQWKAIYRNIGDASRVGNRVYFWHPDGYVVWDILGKSFVKTYLGKPASALIVDRAGEILLHHGPSHHADSRIMLLPAPGGKRNTRISFFSRNVVYIRACDSFYEVRLPDEMCRASSSISVYGFDKGKFWSECRLWDKMYMVDVCEFDRIRVSLIAKLLRVDELQRHVLKYLVPDEGWI